MRVFNGAPIDMPAGLESSCRRFCNRSMDTSFDVRAAAETTEIDLYDEIGYFGVDAREFKERLRDADDVHLRINSPGGDVFDGITMYNDLVSHQGQVTIEVVGMAASAASLIAMAADEGRLLMADNAFLMVHNAWTVVGGDRHMMNDAADTLGKIDNALNGVYKARTGQTKGAISKIMDAETWLTAGEAVEQGFADKAVKVANASSTQFDLSAFNNTPESLRASFEDAPCFNMKRKLERILTQDAGLSRTNARALMRSITGTQDAADPPVMRDADWIPDFESLITDLRNTL